MGTGHLYVTAHGEFLNAWAGEFAQMGMRIGVWPIGTASGPIRPLHDLGAPTETYNTYSTTNFDVIQQFNQDTPGVPISFSEFCDDLAEDFRTFLNTVKSYQSTGFRWTHLKMSPVELGTGKMRVPGSIYTLKSPLAGGVTAMLPPEVSVALSTRAAIVGRRGRGRMYLPGLSTGVSGNDGKVPVGTRNTLAAALKQLVVDINDQPGLDTMDIRSIICSGNSTSAVIPTEVRVGDHLDAQRRRQHQVDETYTTLSL